MASPADRRRFRRIQAPVFCRPRGAPGGSRIRQEVRDISRGGMRVFSDDSHPLGTRLELELLLADGQALVFDAEVVWVDALPEGSPAKFDVGLRYIAPQEGEVERLAEVLGPEE
jgi:c-di-GMP-binding flagellar brake protein YcgR